MPELYQEITRHEPNPNFVLVSAISHWFDGRIEGFLKDSAYPPHQRYLRNWLTEWSINGFKTSAFDSILRERSKREFIVIFDNSAAILDLAESLSTTYPQIKDIYLRRVVEKKSQKVL